MPLTPRSPAAPSLPVHPARALRDSSWLLPSGLLLVSAVPLVAGTWRLYTMGTGALFADDARYAVAPVPLVVHIASILVYTVAGAFQVTPAVRRRHPAWHRRLGALALPAGLTSALSGLWLIHVFPPAADDGPLLYLLRFVVGAAMTWSLIAGALALVRRSWAAHGAWMIRAYAIGLGAGTQVLTHLPYFLVDGLDNEAGRLLAMGAGWGVNLAVAEWIIRRRRDPSPLFERPALVRA